MSLIYSKLYDDIFTRNFALGLEFKTLGDFINSTIKSINSKKLNCNFSHNLDFYIETQIHGKISLKKDISTLVVDFSYKDTEFESRFIRLCEKYSINLIWNLGYQLSVNEFPDDFRGIETQTFVKKIAKDNFINAYIIGKAFENKQLKLEYNDFEVFQLSKYVWHCLVKFGKKVKPAPNNGYK